MAFSLVGTISVNITARNLNPFPVVNLKRNKGFLFYLETAPLTLVPDYVYFCVIPQISIDGLAYERPKLTNWFPKGGRMAFKVSTLEKFGDPVPCVINLFPVEIFSGRGQPKEIVCSLYVDLAEEEDPSLVI